MAERYIYTIEGLSKKHGEKQVLKDIWLSFYPGAKIGVLGKNGAGKSTLLKIMAGVETEFEGKAELTRGFTVGYVPQEPRLNTEKNVFDNVMEGVEHIKKVLDRYEAVNKEFENPDADFDKLLAEQAKLQEQIDATDAWNLERRVEIAMEAMQLPPGDANVTKLSGGERRRVALCKTLLRQPDLLLLDEPTNHLDAESVHWLEHHLTEYPGTVVAVTHDRYFLDNAAQWILELDRGKGIPWKGNYASWLEQKQSRLLIEEKKETARQKSLKRELEWVRSTPKARSVKSKSRLAAFEKLQSDAADAAEEEFEIFIPPGPPLGELVFDVNELAKSFGERLLFENMTFRVPRGAIVGIIGPNGAGKTTLFKMLAGHEQPDRGTIRVGDTVKLGYIDQNRDTLENDKSVWDEISGGVEFLEFPGGRRLNTRAYAAQFGFKGIDQQKLVGNLSGGERNRVHLAKLLRRGLNVIMLDEPSNDLDIDTLRSLEESLLSFPGCVLVTSHDRWFLDRLATHILAFEGDHVHWCEGNFQTYIEQKKERLGDDPDGKAKVKRRKLSRD